MSKPVNKITMVIFLFVVCILTLIKENMVLARQVYKSVDAEGNVTYSSTPPKEAVQTERMSVSGKGNATYINQNNDNIEKMKNLAGEMEKERMQRRDDRSAANKKREEERAKRDAEEAKKRAENPPEPEIRYYPVYIPRRHPPGRPNRPRPEPRPQQR